MKIDPKAAAREPLFRWFFFGVFALVLWQCVVVFLPFFAGFLWAVILTLMFNPAHTALLRSKRWSANTAAALSTAAVLLGVIVPLALIGWMFYRESKVILPTVRVWESELAAFEKSPEQAPVPPAMEPYVDEAQAVLGPLGVDLRESAVTYIDIVSHKINEQGERSAHHLVLTLVNLGVLAVSVFFFFRDGEAYILWFMDLIPMEQASKRHLFERVRSTFTAVVRGVLMSAMLQALLLGLGYRLAGVRFPVLLGVVSLFAAFIPIGGAFLVWGPICLMRAAEGVAPALILAAWCLAASILDHVLKAYLIGTKARLPVLVLFLALLGGLYAYGLIGILLGPVLVASALAFIGIYQEEYGIRLPVETPEGPEKGHVL